MVLFLLAGLIPEEKEHFSFEAEVEKGKIYEFHAPCEIVVSGNEWADFAEIDMENYTDGWKNPHLVDTLKMGEYYTFRAKKSGKMKMI